MLYSGGKKDTFTLQVLDTKIMPVFFVKDRLQMTEKKANTLKILKIRTPPNSFV